MTIATRMKLARISCLTVAVLLAGIAAVRTSDGHLQQDPLAEPFRGVTTDSTIMPNLFPIRVTGVSTEPVRVAADAFLASLTEAQREKTEFAADDIEWRRWNNVHRAEREGVSFGEMTDAQRDAAIGMLRASLSAQGLEKTRSVMRLNGYLAELLPERADEYGEGRYWLTVMGEPSATQPWGWQLDGHHLVVNYFVLGDQVVMTPTFMGSEPVSATSGRYAGTVVLQEEERKGLALMQSLDALQRVKATIGDAKTRNNALAQAYRDNLVLDYAGIQGSELTPSQRTLLIDLVAEYVGNMRDGHARIRMEEVTAHLDDTHFAWIGEVGPEAVFYYRIQSPVILIEFDHQTPVALPGPRVPTKSHVHTVVRTPNGNDYGKDLLRQHYERHRDDPAHGHSH
jgi:hypothetical protein